jgi:hypothetical protein
MFSNKLDWLEILNIIFIKEHHSYDGFLFMNLKYFL